MAASTQTIVYISNKNMFTIATIGIDGGDPRQLTTDAAIWPEFSPDGTRIACLYSAEPNAQYMISIIPTTRITNARSRNRRRNDLRFLPKHFHLSQPRHNLVPTRNGLGRQRISAFLT
jgi:hypothetical protein